MSDRIQVDITLLGGGIAGLWSAAYLKRLGYSVALIESHAIGGVQTIASQGIIHGGTKYALRGNLSESARAIAEMPGIWRACLTGEGPLDLRQVRVLAQHQYLWSTDNLLSQLAGFFAGKAMRSRMQAVNRSEHPVPFDNPGFEGRLYRLDEPVLDAPSLVRTLFDQVRERTLLVPPERLTFDPNHPGSLTFDIAGERLTLQSQCIILAAGKGNAGLLRQLDRDQPAMQLRPLHMVMLRGRLPPLFAHCLGAQANPRLTITSHPVSESEMIWYVGGQLAEDGVGLSAERQVEMAEKELRATMPRNDPGVDFSGVDWRTFVVERAEPRVGSGIRPDSCYLHHERGIITAWPTKLAFAPRLATEVHQLLRSQGVEPTAAQPEILARLPKPPLAHPPWQEPSK